MSYLLLWHCTWSRKAHLSQNCNPALWMVKGRRCGAASGWTHAAVLSQTPGSTGETQGVPGDVYPAAGVIAGSFPQEQMQSSCSFHIDAQCLPLDVSAPFSSQRLQLVTNWINVIRNLLYLTDIRTVHRHDPHRQHNSVLHKHGTYTESCNLPQCQTHTHTQNHTHHHPESAAV